MNADKLLQLIANCRRSRDRFLGSIAGFPSDWCPHKILNPDMPPGYYFSDESAWEFIADKLAGGHPYEVISMRVPPGAVAIEMKVQIRGYDKHLYIKVQVGANNKAIGRSFHISHLTH
jgi:hypothetical protein